MGTVERRCGDYERDDVMMKPVYTLAKISGNFENSEISYADRLKSHAAVVHRNLSSRTYLRFSSN
jgi:hypothetical protein